MLEEALGLFFFLKSHKLSGLTVCKGKQMMNGGKGFLPGEFSMEGMIKLNHPFATLVK